MKYQKQSFLFSRFVHFDCDESRRHICYLSAKSPIIIAFNNNMGHTWLIEEEGEEDEKEEIFEHVNINHCVLPLFSMAILHFLSLSRYLICYCCIRCCCCFCCHCYYSLNKWYDESVEWMHTQTAQRTHTYTAMGHL